MLSIILSLVVALRIVFGIGLYSINCLLAELDAKERYINGMLDHLNRSYFDQFFTDGEQS